MKFDFSLKDKKMTLNADVEKLVEKKMDLGKDKPQKKTRYQIKQEEKRKMEELKHKQDMQKLYIAIGLFAVLMVVVFVMAAIEG